MARLLPPWQPVGIVAEAGSLADGQAVLSAPGGLRLVSDHQPADFDPPARFVDELAQPDVRSWPTKLAARGVTSTASMRWPASAPG